MADYALMTPALNEREHLPSLLDSLAGQDLPPVLWLVVDDGSTDGSFEWLEERATELPWLEVRRSPEISDEYLGHHIARLKAWGLAQLQEIAAARGLDLLAVGVLDADLSLPPDHYRRLLDAFAADPRLGVTSSLIAVDGEPPERLQRSDLPRGGTQTFRTACLAAIGGLPPYSGFDGAANVKARLAGWETRLLADVVARHARPTATRFGIGPGYARKGRYAWFLDLHPAIVAARTVAYTVAAPHTGGLHFLRGWLGSAMHREARCPDAEVRDYYRRERPREYLRKLRGKGPGFVR